MQFYRIAPSILAADCLHLSAEIEAVLDAGTDLIHFDVMDNHYVPNLTFGPSFCRAISKKFGNRLSLDVHLMVKPVDRLIHDFIAAGADIISIHPESTEHLDRSLELIRQGGCRAGLALNPATPLEQLQYVMPKLDLLLLMSVNPGFGGQTFISYTLDKIRMAKSMLVDAGYPNINIQVDGGINVANIASIASAGADTFVAGSAIFGSANYNLVISTMRAALSNVRA